MGLHKESQCKGHCKISSPSHISAQEILLRPVTAPTQPVEKVAENLVRRLMAENEDRIVKIPTKGQVGAYKCYNFSTLTLAIESSPSVHEQCLHF